MFVEATVARSVSLCGCNLLKTRSQQGLGCRTVFYSSVDTTHLLPSQPLLTSTEPAVGVELEGPQSIDNIKWQLAYIPALNNSESQEKTL